MGIEAGRVDLTLLQNHPNPFNPTTYIDFELDGDGLVSIRVYDVSERPIRTLVDGHKTPGIHTEKWDVCDDNGHQVASGVCLCRLSAGNRTLTKMMALLKQDSGRRLTRRSAVNGDDSATPPRQVGLDG